MSSKSLNDLLKPVKDRTHQFLSLCELNCISVLITCTYRSAEEQAALYAQGRQLLIEVNKLRDVAGLLPITDNLNKIITRCKAGESAHEYRCAFDIVPLEGGKCVWNTKHPLWEQVGSIGVSCGLVWGGNWGRFKDYPHFQYTGGLTIKDLQSGKIPT